jgi:hypothetical protein
MTKIRTVLVTLALAVLVTALAAAPPARADTRYAYCGTTYAQLMYYPDGGGAASTRLSYESGLFTASNTTETLWTTTHGARGISVQVNQGQRFTTTITPPAWGSLITIKAGPIVAPEWLDCRVGQVGHW